MTVKSQLSPSPFSRLPHLAALLVGTPLMIEPAKLEALLQVLSAQDLQRHAATVFDARGASGSASPLEAVEPGMSEDGIAVIQAVGSLTKRSLGLDALSGLTSYDHLQEQLNAALLDPSVQGIVLDVDSPGGEASGVFDLADAIRAGRSLKPIYAAANDRALSAAYALASSASRVFVSRTAAVGSIGVIAMHVDQSAQDAARGLRYTPVYAGERKADLSPHAPISDAARSQLQNEVDRLYGLFVDTVASNRSLSTQAVRGSEAGVFFGEGAVQAGFADAVGTLQDALQAMRAELRAGRAGTAAHGSGSVLLSTHSPPPIPTTRPPTGPPTQTAAAPQPSPAFGSPQSPQGLVVLEPASDLPTPFLKDLHAMSTPETQATAPAGATAPATPSMAAPALPVNPPAVANPALQIADLCLLAGCPERTAEFLARGVGEDVVRRELLAARAQGTRLGGEGFGGEITSHIAPGAVQLGGPPAPAALPIEQNPLVLAAQARSRATR